MRAGEVKSPSSETSTTYSGIARGFAHNEQTHQDDDILLVVDFCLVEWARWARRRFHRLGYPGTTPEVQAGMGRRDKKSGTAPEPTHALAEAVEGVVVGLPDRLYEVTLKEYVDGRGMKRQRARDLAMGETQYSQLLRAAQYAVHAAIRPTTVWRVVWDAHGRAD